MVYNIFYTTMFEVVAMVKVVVEVPETTLQAYAEVVDPPSWGEISDFAEVIRAAATKRRYEVLRYIFQHSPAKPTEIAKHLHSNTASIVLRELFAYGLVSKTPRGYVLTILGTVVYAILASLPVLAGGE